MAAQGITSEARSYRAAPSAGATYPLEIYVATGRVNRLRPGLYRYVPADHSLLLVSEGDLREELAAAALNQQMLRNAPVSFIIAADYERTAGRYGERAERYVHIEVGHAAQNLNLQAISLGLGSVMVGAFNDSNIKSIMKFPDNEDPLYILPVGRPAQ
jgi:SagB-type dehydrogenase family enzyme